MPPPARYVNNREESYDPAVYTERLDQARKAVPDPVHLSIDQQKEALKTIVAEIGDMPLVPTVVAVDATHVHLLASFGDLKIRKVVGRLKSVVTRAIKSDTFQPKRVWAKNCHMRSMNSEDAFRNAFRYVQNHQKQNAFVYIWKNVDDQPTAKPSAWVETRNEE